MECPHLSSSVCIAPDSAKFPNGSPSSWCCSVIAVTILWSTTPSWAWYRK
uniref:Ubiquitin specific peptidase 3 n=1 Tax=Mus musculus TaxID=10090 RepID=D6RG67_MOUSE